MKLKHLFLALLTVLVWGLNFIAIHYGLKTFPPLLVCAVRFGLAAIPFVFFLPKPKAPWHFIFGYGIFTFAMQFGLLFTGIHLGHSPGAFAGFCIPGATGAGIFFHGSGRALI